MIDFIPELKEKISIDDIEKLHPLVLSFVGDAVQTLYVRTDIAISNNLKINDLHKLTSDKINASSQSEYVSKILDMLTSEELKIYKRARNSKIKSSAKNAKVLDYKRASGLEAVIGFLYLSDQHERLKFLLTREGEHK